MARFASLTLSATVLTLGLCCITCILSFGALALGDSSPTWMLAIARLYFSTK